VIARAVAELPEGRVAVAVGDLPERFRCDPELLQVALRNLLANAERHSPADRPVSLSARSIADCGVEFVVTDLGAGISPDELPHVFRKYFRGRAAKGSPGAGLGLYLVDRIARRHGGSVSVESSPGSGATFRVRIPATLED
jgi:signal transduction histidine kinase